MSIESIEVNPPNNTEYSIQKTQEEIRNDWHDHPICIIFSGRDFPSELEMDWCVEQNAEKCDDDKIDQSYLSSCLTDNRFEWSIVSSKNREIYARLILVKEMGIGTESAFRRAVRLFELAAATS